MGENELKQILREHGQEHIIEAYDALDEAGKEKLANQVAKIDWSMVAMAGHRNLPRKEVNWNRYLHWK